MISFTAAEITPAAEGPMIVFLIPIGGLLLFFLVVMYPFVRFAAWLQQRQQEKEAKAWWTAYDARREEEQIERKRKDALWESLRPRIPLCVEPLVVGNELVLVYFYKSGDEFEATVWRTDNTYTEAGKWPSVAAAIDGLEGKEESGK